MLALTTVPAVALVTFTCSARTRSCGARPPPRSASAPTPDALLGRVTGVYHVGVMLGIVIGTPIGGLLAARYGITAPFWFGFIGSAVLVTVLWRQFDNIAHAGDVHGGGDLAASGRRIHDVT